MKNIIIYLCLIIIFFLIFISYKTYKTFENFNNKIGPILFYDYNKKKIGTYPDDKIWPFLFKKKEGKYINLIGTGEPLEITFPKSKKGEIGPRGYSGLQGNHGKKGKKGETITGIKGPDGNQGLQGLMGSQGECDICNIGIQGPTGYKGRMGNQGPKGPTGKRRLSNEAPQGEEGKPGPQGPKSTVIGDQGPHGPIGNRGSIGLPGNKGDDGSDGILNQIVNVKNGDYLLINREEDVNSPKEIKIGNNLSKIDISSKKVNIKELCIDKNGHRQLCINKADIARLYEFNNPNCSCPNGEIVDKCTYNGIECKSCDTGYNLQDTILNGRWSKAKATKACVANTCICHNGNKATGTACTENGGHICIGCNAGYYQDGNICKENICKCNNGNEAKGDACTSNGANICTGV